MQTYDRALYVRNGLRALHAGGARGIPPDPVWAGPAEQRGPAAVGYELLSASSSGPVNVRVTDRCYRGLLRYESPFYDDRSKSHDTDKGSLQVCTTRSGDGQAPGFLELSVFLFGDAANHLHDSEKGVPKGNKCVVYDSVGAVISRAVRVVAAQPPTAEAHGITINNGQTDVFVVYGASGNTEIQGTLTVGNEVKLKNTLTVSGEARMENNLIALGEVRAEQFIAVSDKRLKQNITELKGEDALQVVSQLRPTTYQMISTPDANRCGLLAQEVREVLPSCVVSQQQLTTAKKTKNSKDEEPFLGVNYTDVVAYLIGAVRELKTQLDVLRRGGPAAPAPAPAAAGEGGAEAAAGSGEEEGACSPRCCEGQAAAAAAPGCK